MKSTKDARRPLSLFSVNHISRVCSDLEASYKFYTEVLGFMEVKRPSSFSFEGAWLYNYGMGLHLIKGSPPSRPSKIEPKSCHISFQAGSLEEVERCLEAWSIPYVRNVFVEEGVQIGQLFFHDPDNNMIEVCNCDELPLVPLTEGALACAARPLPVAVQALAAMPPAPGSDATVDISDCARSEASAISTCTVAVSEEAGGTGRRSHSFSDSSMSQGRDLSALSVCTADLDDWLGAHGDGSVRSAGKGSGALSGGCAGVAAAQERPGSQDISDEGKPLRAEEVGAEVISVLAIAAGCHGSAE